MHFCSILVILPPAVAIVSLPSPLSKSYKYTFSHCDNLKVWNGTAHAMIQRSNTILTEVTEKMSLKYVGSKVTQKCQMPPYTHLRFHKYNVFSQVWWIVITYNKGLMGVSKYTTVGWHPIHCFTRLTSYDTDNHFMVAGSQGLVKMSSARSLIG